MSFKKFAVNLRKEFQICEKRHQPFLRTKMRRVLSQKRSRLNFPPSFFPRGLLNRQSANLMEYMRSLLRTQSYTPKVHDDDANRGWPAANESFRGFSLFDPTRSLSALFLPFCFSLSIFCSALDIENAHKPNIHVVSKYCNFERNNLPL